MFLFYCQNIVLGSSRISIFDCQGSFETFLMIVIFCWQTVLFLAAYPPSVTVVAIQHYIVSMQEERYRARGNTYHEWNYRVPSTPFASARAKRTIIYNFAFVPCLCVRVAMVTLVSGPGSIINQAGPGQRRVRVWSVTKANVPDTETSGSTGTCQVRTGLSWWLLSRAVPE